MPSGVSLRTLSTIPDFPFRKWITQSVSIRKSTAANSGERARPCYSAAINVLYQRVRIDIAFPTSRRSKKGAEIFFWLSRRDRDGHLFALAQTNRHRIEQFQCRAANARAKFAPRHLCYRSLGLRFSPRSRHSNQPNRLLISAQTFYQFAATAIDFRSTLPVTTEAQSGDQKSCSSTR